MQLVHRVKYGKKLTYVHEQNEDGSHLSAYSHHLQSASSPHRLPPLPFLMPASGQTVGDWGTVEDEDGGRWV